MLAELVLSFRYLGVPKANSQRAYLLLLKPHALPVIQIAKRTQVLLHIALMRLWLVSSVGLNRVADPVSVVDLWQVSLFNFREPAPMVLELPLQIHMDPSHAVHFFMVEFSLESKRLRVREWVTAA